MKAANGSFSLEKDAREMPKQFMPLFEDACEKVVDAPHVVNYDSFLSDPEASLLCAVEVFL